MIAALLFATAVDPYDAVMDAERQARDCEMRVIGDAFLRPAERPMDELHAEARRVCGDAWNDHARARVAYFTAHCRALTRQVPGFRPDVEACWNAFDAQRHWWPGASENTALNECKNAQD